MSKMNNMNKKIKKCLKMNFNNPLKNNKVMFSSKKEKTKKFLNLKQKLHKKLKNNKQVNKKTFMKKQILSREINLQIKLLNGQYRVILRVKIQMEKQIKKLGMMKLVFSYRNISGRNLVLR